MNIAHSLFEAARKITGISPTSEQASLLFGVKPSQSGQVVTHDSALTLSAVYNACDVISNAMMVMPLFSYTHLDGQGKQFIREHPVFDILHRRPNPNTTWPALIKLMTVWKLLWGNARMEIERDSSSATGKPLALWPIHPSISWTKQLDDGKIIHQVNNRDGTISEIPDHDIIHSKGMSLDGLNGLSRIAMGSDSLGLYMAQEAFAARFFGKNAMPGMVVTHPKRLSPKAKSNLRATWEKAYGGDNQGGVAVLDEGVEPKVLQMGNTEAQFLESRTFSVLEVARWFNISPHKIKELSRATFSNIEKLALEFVGDTVMPHAVEFEAECTRKLFTEDEQRGGMFCEFLMDALLRADSVTRNKSFAIKRQWGTISGDEWRAKDNEPPIPDGHGEKYWMPTNMKEIGVEPKGQVVPESQLDPESILDAHQCLLEDAIGRVNRNVENAQKRCEKNGNQIDALKFQAQFCDAIRPILVSLGACVRCSVEGLTEKLQKDFLAEGPSSVKQLAKEIIDMVRETME